MPATMWRGCLVGPLRGMGVNGSCVTTSGLSHREQLDPSSGADPDFMGPEAFRVLFKIKNANG